MAEQIVALIVGTFFGTCLGFLLCLGIMFWMGIIGKDLREFLDESVDELIGEFKRLVSKK